MRRGPTCVVVPAKGFARAKSRLAPALDAEARAAVARALLASVLAAVEGCSAIDAILVATDDDEVAASVGPRVRVARDPGPSTLGAVVDHALAHAARLGAQRAIVLMGDLPAITRADVAALADALDAADVVVAPDGSGDRTNALGLALPARFVTQFGATDSLHRHLAEARAAGLTVARVARPALAFDVDLPADLARWRSGAPPV